MMNYEIVETQSPMGEISQILKRTDENGLVAWIPIDLANSDYQAYLAANSGSSQAKELTES